MPTVNGVSNDVFANTLRALARTSATAAKGAAERADRLPDGSRRLGQEISVDGNVSAGEMSEFVRVTSGVAQGLSAGEKRLGNAARILHQAMFEVPSTPIALTPNVLEASWRREVPVAGLTGNVEVRNEIDHRLVLSTDRRQFAQRIAGPGQRTISPDDFNKALPMLSLDERYLRPSEVDHLHGDASKAREKLGWSPKVSFEGLVTMMVDADLKLAEREARANQ